MKELTESDIRLVFRAHKEILEQCLRELTDHRHQLKNALGIQSQIFSRLERLERLAGLPPLDVPGPVHDPATHQLVRTADGKTRVVALTDEERSRSQGSSVA